VRESLTAALTAPPPQMDPTAWAAARRDAAAALARLAAGRRGAGGRVTDHGIRVAGVEETDDAPFEWSARTARRAVGLAAVRALAAGRSRTPAEAVQARLAECAGMVERGDGPASGLDRWVAALGPAGRAAVAAEAVTWATRLWCALDWDALEGPLAIGRDHWWDSPHSALLALRGRAEVRTARADLVVLSGPRRASVHAELSLVPLVETLRDGTRAAPRRVVGWWPDSGHHVRLDPQPWVLGLAADAVAQVLAAAPLRPAA
jgi:hypothetical protein